MGGKNRGKAKKNSQKAGPKTNKKKEKERDL